MPVKFALKRDTALTDTCRPLWMKSEISSFYFIAKCLVIDAAIYRVKGEPFPMTAEKITESAETTSQLSIEDVICTGRDRSYTDTARELSAIDRRSKTRECRERHCSTSEFAHWLAVEFEGAIQHATFLFVD